MVAITVTVRVNGSPLPAEVELDAAALATLADALPAREPEPESPFLNVEEAATLLRTNPQRIYDLTSSGRLTRHKDGTRVLLDRREVLAYLDNRNSRTRSQ